MNTETFFRSLAIVVVMTIIFAISIGFAREVHPFIGVLFGISTCIAIGITLIKTDSL